MRKEFVLFLAWFLILLNLSLVLADGGFFPRYPHWVSPGEQRAIIFHEGNVETLILASNFRGNAKELAWIVPTPTRPEVTKANEQIFVNIQELTTPQYNYGYGLRAMSMGIEGTKDLGVVVIESKQVDYYDVNVLLATSSADLVEWFNENNYTYPEEYAYVLNYYIQKGWYFTAIKVSPEAQGATDVIQDLKEGHPTPIKMVFLSEKIVFPLKISSVDFKPKDEVKYGAAKDEPIGATRKDEHGNIWTKQSGDNWKTNAQGYEHTGWGDMLIDEQLGGIDYVSQYDRYGYNSNYVPIHVYVIANAKYESDKLRISYGNWFKKSQIEDLGDDENGKPFISPSGKKYFITYLTASLQKSQMDEDVFFEKADDNKKVNAGPEAWQLFIYGLIIACFIFVIWVFMPTGIMFIAGTLILFLSSNKVARVFGWIMEGLSLAITFLVGAIIFVSVLVNNALGNYVAISILSTFLLLIVIMVLLMVLEIKYKKRK